MKIMAAPSAGREDVFDRLATSYSATARFTTEMFTPLWVNAEQYGVDPVGVIAQAYKETAGGAYTGKVKPWMYNTCGLKVRDVNSVMAILKTTDVDHTLVHSQFASFWVGAEAHVQHLRAYVGVPFSSRVVDPRYSFVSKRVTDWFQLGGAWAPSVSYGTELEAIMRKLQGV